MAATPSWAKKVRPATNKAFRQSDLAVGISFKFIKSVETSKSVTLLYERDFGRRSVPVGMVPAQVSIGKVRLQVMKPFDSSVTTATLKFNFTASSLSSLREALQCYLYWYQNSNPNKEIDSLRGNDFGKFDLNILGKPTSGKAGGSNSQIWARFLELGVPGAPRPVIAIRRLR